MNSLRLPDKRVDLGLVAGVAAVLISALPLLTKSLPFDWDNHTWMVNYQAHYLLHHFHLTPVFNTEQLMGMCFPVFYGYLFFPFMSVFSTVFDANASVRFFVIALMLTQFAVIYGFFKRTTGDRVFAVTVATLIAWAIYPLTNLYHRTAIPEFFATALLTCACITLLNAVSAKTAKKFVAWCNISVLALCAAAGSHPITAVYGLCFYGLLLAASFALHRIDRKQNIKVIVSALVVPGLIASFCLAPWVFATAKYHRHLHIARGFDQINFYPKSIDSLVLRISPIPVPSRMLTKHIKREHMNTPHLDAELNTALLLLLTAFSFSIHRRKEFRRTHFFILTAALFVSSICTYISITPAVFNKIGYVARSIQFAYRMVTYINLSLLCGVALLCMERLKHRNIEETQLKDRPSVPGANCLMKRGVLAGIVAISFMGLVVKLAYTHYMAPISGPFLAHQRDEHELLQLPPRFYGSVDYGMPQLLPELKDSDKPKPLNLTPNAGAAFGFSQTLPLPADAECLYTTNVQAFSWNRLQVDSRWIEEPKLSELDGKLALRAAGGMLLYRFDPPHVWSLLNIFSLPVFFLWAFTSFVMLYAAAYKPAKVEKIQPIADPLIGQPGAPT